MRAAVVVESDPVADDACGILNALETVPMKALLLERSDMIEQGRWRATKPEVLGHHSYRLNTFGASILPTASWGVLACEFLAAKRDPATGIEGAMTDPQNAVPALIAARATMRTVTGLDSKTILDARPKYLVVGAELEGAAEQALAAIYAATAHDVNPMSGKLELVVEPRIKGISWFLMADPARVPSLQYGYLAAAQGVQIQRQDAWDTLGLKYRAWLDFGCGWLDWRSAYFGAGA